MVQPAGDATVLRREAHSVFVYVIGVVRLMLMAAWFVVGCRRVQPLTLLRRARALLAGTRAGKLFLRDGFCFGNGVLT